MKSFRFKASQMATVLLTLITLGLTSSLPAETDSDEGEKKKVLDAFYFMKDKPQPLSKDEKKAGSKVETTETVKPADTLTTNRSQTEGGSQTPVPDHETEKTANLKTETNTQPVNQTSDDENVTVVTATRLEESPFDSPYAITSLSQKSMREKGYRTTPEALRDIPSVMIQKTAHGQGSPFIRGHTGYRNVFLIDGVRLNNSTFRSGPNQYWNTVDNYAISSFEVLKGPGSVQWGSDAIGGTVNAITQDPYSSSPDGGWHWAGRSLIRLSSAERSVVARQELSAGYGNVGVIGGITIKDFGNLRAGSGELPDTGYGEWDADIKVVAQVDEHIKLVVLHQHVEQNNVPRTHRTVNAIPFKGSSIGTDIQRDLDQKRDLVYVQVHIENLEDSLITNGIFSISWHRQQEEQDRIRSTLARVLQGVQVDTIGIWAQYESPLPLGHIVYGFDFYHDKVDSFSTSNPIQGPVGDNATYDSLALHLQYFLPATERINFIYGARYNYAHADANAVQDPGTGLPFSLNEDWEALVGSVRMQVQVDDEDTIHFYTGVSQGFRAPNLSDLTRLDTARTDEIEVPSPGLDPERFVNVDIGLKVQNENTKAEFSYYYTSIRNMIVRTPTGAFIGPDAVVAKRNLGDGWVHGVEISVSQRLFEQFTLFGHLSAMDGKVDTFPTSAPVLVREPIDRIMPVTGQVGLRFDIPDEMISIDDYLDVNGSVFHNAWIEVVGTFAEAQQTLSTRDANDTSRIPPGGTPGYAIMSIRGGFQIGENTTLNLAVENVFNRNYRVHGSGVNEPGRNFIAFLEVFY